MDKSKFTRNGDTFTPNDLFVIAKGLTQLADHFRERNALGSSTEYLRLAQRVYTEYGDYHSATECRKKMFEQNKEARHSEAARITTAVMSFADQMQPDTLQFKRKNPGAWVATAAATANRPTLRFVLDKQGDNWIAKTSKAVAGHGFVPYSFDSASTLKGAKLACERRLIAANDEAADRKRA